MDLAGLHRKLDAVEGAGGAERLADTGHEKAGVGQSSHGSSGGVVSGSDGRGSMGAECCPAELLLEVLVERGTQ